ncbi:ABC transporter, class E [Aphelenchoides besseyi]|nr:ABC transporter, class E [Aphelenchoides besseyi]
MTVSDCLNKVSARDNLEKVIDQLELRHLLDRQPDHLSGGELQRFAIAMCIVSKADVYLFDEPSSYLDVRQRLEAAKAIRECRTSSNYVMVVEHDLARFSTISLILFAFCMECPEPIRQTQANEPQALLDGMNQFLEILRIST